MDDSEKKEHELEIEEAEIMDDIDDFDQDDDFLDEDFGDEDWDDVIDEDGSSQQFSKPKKKMNANVIIIALALVVGVGVALFHFSKPKGGDEQVPGDLPFQSAIVPMGQDSGPTNDDDGMNDQDTDFARTQPSDEPGFLNDPSSLDTEENNADLNDDMNIDIDVPPMPSATPDADNTALSETDSFDDNPLVPMPEDGGEATMTDADDGMTPRLPDELDDDFGTQNSDDSNADNKAESFLQDLTKKQAAEPAAPMEEAKTESAISSQEMANMQAELDDTKMELMELEAKSTQTIQDLQTQIASLKADLKDVEEDNQQLEQELSAAKAAPAPAPTPASAPKNDPEPEITAPAPKEVATPATKPQMQKPTPVAKTTSTGWELRAAMPGKAWIARPGETQMQTVVAGDTIDSIGQVQSITYNGGKWVIQGSKGKIVQ